MRLNGDVILRGPAGKVLLVPYVREVVPTYHGWLKDPWIREMTCSEPLSLQEEFQMQQSWGDDADKLTFIVCVEVPDGAQAQPRAPAEGADQQESLDKIP